jgi:hypothetical protein
MRGEKFMITKRSFLIMAFIAMIAPVLANAQTPENAQGWNARRILKNTRTSVGRQTDGSDKLLQSQAGRQESESGAVIQASDDKIIGTWVVHIPASDGGGAPFDALHTFNGDGTFVETSSLLATLTEGPAHGVWKGKKRDYDYTFELFVFNADQTVAGRVRVYGSIHINGDNNFTGTYTVAFINLDGSVDDAIDGGEFAGTRLQIIK